MDRPNGRSRVLNFRMPLSYLGEPDEEFARCSNLMQVVYRCDPGLAKWIVQEAPGRRFNLHFCALPRLFYIGFQKPVYETVPDDSEEHELDVLGSGFNCGPERQFEPHAYEYAEVHFVGKMLDGTVFTSSRENNTPVTFKLKQGNVMPGIALAAASMRPGEKAVFTIPQEFVINSGSAPSIPCRTLRFDIELISLVTDILGDQGIVKKTIKFGTGAGYPRGSDEVIVSYNACLKDGTSVSKSERVGFSIAKGFFCPAFAHAVKTMTEGEEAVLIVKPEYGFGEPGRCASENETTVPPGAILHINLQVLSLITVSYIGENRDILKKTLRQAKQTDNVITCVGAWSCIKPYNEAIVKVRLIGKLQDGTVFDRRGHNGEEPLEFTIDQEHVIYGLDEAVMTMHKGEVASFTIPPKHAFGVTGSNKHQFAIVPPNSFVIYEIELLSVDNGDWPRSLPVAAKLEIACRKEMEGNDLFSTEKYLRAYRKYFRAIQILRWDFQDFIFEERIITLILKCAECAIRLERYEQALDRYREVLHYDEKNVTALQMLAHSFPKSSVEIDTLAMHRGLEIQRRQLCGGGGPSKQRLKHGHKLSGSMIVVPRARPQGSRPMSASPRPAAGQTSMIVVPRPVAQGIQPISSALAPAATPANQNRNSQTYGARMRTGSQGIYSISTTPAPAANLTRQKRNSHPSKTTMAGLVCCFGFKSRSAN